MPGSPTASADPAALDAELRALHHAPRSAARAARLAALHEAAAELVEAAAARFHLTHAWVHALEAGDAAEAARLESRLKHAGGFAVPFTETNR
ncbi:MAG: hypothetical protein AAGI51_02070 [Pseudomonadota bacterium]